MTVVVRTQASEQVGMGHLVRTLALVEPWLERTSVWFATEIEDPALLARIEAAGCRHIPLSSGAACEEDVARIKAATGGESLELVITDHYGLGATWQRAIRPHTQRILAVDDLADRALDCDVLVDPNLDSTAARYGGLVPEHCRLLVGGAPTKIKGERSAPLS